MAMMRRLRPRLHKSVLGLIYTTALVVWVALVADTAGLAQQAAEPPRFPTAIPLAPPPPGPPRPAPEPPRFPTAIPPAPTSTPRPPQIVAAPTAQVLPDIAPA